ncbi:hypothetical protein [Pseudorhizobium pelagicum]|uniref:Uncharacterized protein n=1 Tax=Pseudorhizobium pelagicum TaxID=1509405 RepID=A0A922T5T7_9HYPH|nr:hypothetical protein [Pseudorhizobium pelagicum]KEQ08954.1 hypothetical protein GV67_10610 [Pseudorhizobium pelagicum]KEQ09945.1 hypothetical protein GV68_21630 [Pseudorhizobium pelagicum]
MKKTTMELMGFGDDHVPLLKVAKRQKMNAMPVTVPVLKGACKSIRARSPLMRDAIVHFDTNPEVVRISDYPIQLEYEIEDRYGVIGSLKHVPMLGVWSRQQQASYFDVISRAAQLDMPWLESRTNRLKKAFWEDYRATYAVLDESELHIQPRWMNLQTIKYHALRHDRTAVAQVRRALAALPDATTIDAIVAGAALPHRVHLFFEDDGSVAQARNLTEINRAFSAVMWLAVQGEITLDMSVVISPATTIIQKSTLLANLQERTV